MTNVAIVTLNPADAELILKRADMLLRRHWNLYGFRRVNSGFETIETNEFGNPYSRPRELKVFGIVVEIPDAVGINTAEIYFRCGSLFAECHMEIFMI